jgi:hypothetical protein
MNTKILGALGILLMVAGIWSMSFIHSAEARGMPKNWLNPDGTLKDQYLKVQKGTSPSMKYIFPNTTAHSYKESKPIAGKAKQK